MDELTKYRITGAIIWLALLILIVPGWYSDPVNYQQAQPWFSVTKMAAEEEQEIRATTTQPAVAVTPSESLDASSTAQTVKQQTPQPSQVATKVDTVEKRQADASATPKVDSVKPQSVEKPTEKSPAWLVRVASYNNIQSANRLLGQLELRYQVTIGDFSTPSQKIYSVRVGPFYNLAEAEEAKSVLDKEFITNSVVVQIR